MNKVSAKATDIQDGIPLPTFGAFFWVPVPVENGVGWRLVLNEDAGLDPDAGHTKLWPTVLGILATTWGNDARLLRRELGDRYTGLPRGRVTQRHVSILIHHGEDAPITDWRQAILDRFHLNGHQNQTSFRFDEHERMIHGDPEAVQELLGVELGLRGILVGDDDDDDSGDEHEDEY